MVFFKGTNQKELKFRSKGCVNVEGRVFLFPQNKIKFPHLAVTALCYLVPASFTSLTHLVFPNAELFAFQRTTHVLSHLQAFSKPSSLPGLLNSLTTFDVLHNF